MEPSAVDIQNVKLSMFCIASNFKGTSNYQMYVGAFVSEI
jgi:hypothetical protein